MLQIIRQTPTQGPHHYSEINSDVNLPKVLPQKALTGLFSSKLPAIYAFYPASAIRY